MSGTSLDGVDLALCNFESKRSFKILKAETIKYDELWSQKLESAVNFTGKELTKLDHDYGVFLGNLILNFQTECDHPIDVISTHGHTIFHEPQDGYTLQIGNINDIFSLTNIPTIADFRSLDVSHGGTGAPLVPIGDLKLFDGHTCLNLGGIANISFEANHEMIAFDICPFNLLLNHYAEKLGFEYDEGGSIAREGNINHSLLKELNEVEYYQMHYPKSLDKTWVIDYFTSIIDQTETDVSNILCTLIEHFLTQITKFRNNSNWIITGGGALNSFFIEKLNEQIEIESISKELIEFKEALIFAFLGLRRLNNEETTLPSVTGTQQKVVSGIVLGDVQHLY